MPELSVLIPARNELWLQKTIEDVLAHAKADTEVIVVLDGQWPDVPLFDHPKLRVTHSASVIGQRAATNLAASMSRATYVMKLDAHCSLDDGFDAKLIAADKELGRPDVTQIPAMYNLRAFNWKCGACGKETYQGPTPTACGCGASGPFERVVYWDLKAGGREKPVRTEFWRFDHELHFQYWNNFKNDPRSRGELVDVMSSIGACFFMRRDRFFELGGLDEDHGSWGQYGTEISCKSWLSGGRHIVNKRTWFAHLFRTQGKDFGMPYPLAPRDVEAARAYSRKLWIDGKWSGAKYPLRWLLEKFAPVPDWTPERIAALPKLSKERKRVDLGPVVSMAGTEQAERAAEDRRKAVQPVNDRHGLGIKEDGEISGERELVTVRDGDSVRLPRIVEGVHAADVTRSKGCVYYSDLQGDPQILTAVRAQLARAAGSLPIVSATLGRLDFGVLNLVPRKCAAVDCGFISWDQQRPRRCPKCGATAVAGARSVFNTIDRGYLSMFRQQLAALEALDTDVAFMCEHDVVYSPSHFDFTPPDDGTFYYNQHTWRVHAETGQAVFYFCNQVSGLCASRSLLVEHYRKIVAHVEVHGFDRALGFEPGGNRRQQDLDPHPVETWMSAECNVDIKSGHCLTKWRDSPDQFRNKETCRGWQEADRVPGWGSTKGRMADWLQDVAAGRLTAHAVLA